MAGPHQRDVDLQDLHPIIRQIVPGLIRELNADGHPFDVFEGFRTPQRQAYLYAQGRTRPGTIVTRAKPWTSYHQYGLAVDLVLRPKGVWSWDTSGKRAASWKRMHELGKSAGLEPLSWELPHLQIAGLKIGDLRAGRYPVGGDDTWAENLESAIAGWTDRPGAPPAPQFLPRRPEIEDDPQPDEVLSNLHISELPVVGTQSWHNKFGGREWRYDEKGIYLKDFEGGLKPLRSPGIPSTCRAIWQLFSVPISTMAKRFGLAPELIVMTIATEASAYRDQNFTGPRTFRWEAHVWNRDVQPPSQGDYSAGPMQTLATTARWVIDAQSLPFHRFQVAPVYRVRPQPPAAHPLYDPVINIEIGTAELKQRLTVTGTDPVLVAAAFNSGGIYQSDANAWHLRSHGNHLDRAAQWFGDACAVLKEAGVR